MTLRGSGSIVSPCGSPSTRLWQMLAPGPLPTYCPGPGWAPRQAAPRASSRACTLAAALGRARLLGAPVGVPRRFHLPKRSAKLFGSHISEHRVRPRTATRGSPVSTPACPASPLAYRSHRDTAFPKSQAQRQPCTSVQRPISSPPARSICPHRWHSLYHRQPPAVQRSHLVLRRVTQQVTGQQG